MSLPPGDIQTSSAKTSAHHIFARRDWLLVCASTIVLTVVYQVIDSALDPSFPSGATQAGRLSVLLVSLVAGFIVSLGAVWEQYSSRSRVEKVLNMTAGLIFGPAFPIWSLVWSEPHIPNIQAIRVAALGFGLNLNAISVCTLSLGYGLRMAQRRGVVASSSASGNMNPQIVGVEPLMWIAAGAWSLLLVAAISYATWLTLTAPDVNSKLLLPLAIFATAFAFVLVAFFWLWLIARRFAQLAGDAALLFSTGQISWPSTSPRRIGPPPNERPRWGVALLIGGGLCVFSLAVFVMLDRQILQGVLRSGQPQWLIAVWMPLVTWMGLLRASARRYPLPHFRILLVAAAACIVAGDALLIDIAHPRHAVVPPLGLLAIALVAASLGVLICRSLLLKPLPKVDSGLAASTPGASVVVDAGGADATSRQARLFPNLVLAQPIFVVAIHVMFYSGTATIQHWGPYILFIASFSVPVVLTAVVNSDMPRQRVERPAKSRA